MSTSSLSATFFPLLAALVVLAPCSSCNSTSTSTTSTTSPGEAATARPLAFAIEAGRAALPGFDGAEIAHLAIPGLQDGYSVRHPTRDSVIVVGGDDSAWEITLRPKLAARRIGKVALSADHRACLGASEGDAVARYMQSSSSVALSKAPANALCLTLRDRNVNMMDVEITAAMDLGGGGMRSGITYLTPDNPAGTCATAPAVCEPRSTPPREAVQRRWRMKDSCRLFDRRAKVAVDLRPLAELPANATNDDCESDGVFLDGQSVSGRFIGLTHARQEGDYIHSTLTLFDMAGGGGAPKKVGSWSIVGETRRTWATSAEAAMVGGKLIVLGDRTKIIDVGTGAQLVEGAPRR